MSVDPGTDFWRETGYGYIRDNGHVYGEVLADDLDVSVRLRTVLETQFDQAGVMLRADEQTWLKTGIEFFEGRPRLSTVLTLGRSSWMVTDLPDGADDILLRVSRRGDAVEVRYQVGEGQLELAALVYMPPGAQMLAGVMAAAPEGPGFRVSFHELHIAERDWSADWRGEDTGPAAAIEPQPGWDSQEPVPAWDTGRPERESPGWASGAASGDHPSWPTADPSGDHPSWPTADPSGDHPSWPADPAGDITGGDDPDWVKKLADSDEPDWASAESRNGTAAEPSGDRPAPEPSGDHPAPAPSGDHFAADPGGDLPAWSADPAEDIPGGDDPDWVKKLADSDEPDWARDAVAAESRNGAADAEHEPAATAPDAPGDEPAKPDDKDGKEPAEPADASRQTWSPAPTLGPPDPPVLRSPDPPAFRLPDPPVLRPPDWARPGDEDAAADWDRLAAGVQASPAERWTAQTDADVSSEWPGPPLPAARRAAISNGLTPGGPAEAPPAPAASGGEPASRPEGGSPGGQAGPGTGPTALAEPGPTASAEPGPTAPAEPGRAWRRRAATAGPLDLPSPPDPADEWISLLTADPADE